MDDDGYPTEETLESIRRFDITCREDFRVLLERIRTLWHYPDFASVRGVRYRFATGGWSGNEELIDAMQENFVFWSLAWRQSAYGGLHVFKIPELADEPSRKERAT